MAESELIISPSIDRQELNQTINQMENAFEQSNSRVGRDLRNQIGKQAARGARDAESSMIASFGKATASLAVGVAGAIVGSLGDADDTISRAIEKLDRLQEVERTAKGLGTTTNEYAQIASAFQLVGYDPEEARGIVEPIYNETLLNDELANYKKLLDEKGSKALFEKVFTNAAQITDKKDQVEFLEKFGIVGDDVPTVIKLANQIAESKKDSSIDNGFEALLSSKGINTNLVSDVDENEVQKYNVLQAKNFSKDINPIDNAVSKIATLQQQDISLNTANDENIDNTLSKRDIVIKGQMLAIEAANTVVNSAKSTFTPSNDLTRVDISSLTREERFSLSLQKSLGRKYESKGIDPNSPTRRSEYLSSNLTEREIKLFEDMTNSLDEINQKIRHQ